MNDPVPSEAELNAYADDALAAEDRRRVGAWLAANPEAAARVEAWRRQNEGLRALFGPRAVARAGDAAMVARYARPRHPALRYAAAAAAAIMIFGAGAVTGRQLAPSAPVATLAAEILPREAKSAFLIYASEVRHPVEVGADEEQHLVTWLGKRLDHPLKSPDLSALGYSLVGGRLVPSGGRSGALLMFENAAGERVTLLVGQNDDNRSTSFRYASDGPVETFYWIDGRLGYAVTGEMPRAELQAVADEIYRQLFTPEGKPADG
jgi:Predicted transmembrane transcriptional regulator (anti-sigma factor)